MSEATATPEEVQRVRELECEQSGHDFEIIQDMGGPVAVACYRCGKRWKGLSLEAEPAKLACHVCGLDHRRTAVCRKAGCPRG